MIPPVLYGTLREHYILLFGAAGAIATVAGSVAAWIGAQFGARRTADGIARAAAAAADAQVARRLEALQQSVDAVAIEVERVTEAQRFSAQLLVDARNRTEALPRARSEARVPTPH